MGVRPSQGITLRTLADALTSQFLNVATVMFDVIRGISYALTLSFPLCA